VYADRFGDKKFDVLGSIVITDRGK